MSNNQALGRGIDAIIKSMSDLLKRTSDSPFIKSVWQLRFDTDGELTVTADGTWDIIFAKFGGELSCVITGPTNQTVTYPHYKGQEALGIQFNIGTYLPGMPAGEIINASRPLPAQRGVIAMGVRPRRRPSKHPMSWCKPLCPFGVSWGAAPSGARRVGRLPLARC